MIHIINYLSTLVSVQKALPKPVNTLSFKDLLLSLIFGLCFSLPFLDTRFFALAWLCFVPLLFAIRHKSYRLVYLYSLVGSVLAMVSGKYWIYDFIVLSKGYVDFESMLMAIAYWVYAAHLLVFSMLVFTWLSRHIKCATLLLFPLSITVFTAIYPLMFNMPLADTQTPFLVALQLIEYTGPLGLSFIVALGNILAFSAIERLIQNKQYDGYLPRLGGLGIAATIILLWLGAGKLSIDSWASQVSTWQTMRIGLIQPNENPTINSKIEYNAYASTYPPEMEMSERLSQLDPALIIWPEAQTKHYFDDEFIKQAYLNNVKKMGTPLLFQDFEPTQNSDIVQQYNSAVFIDNKGQTQTPYKKIKRIPFGEYLPAIANISPVQNLFSNQYGDSMSTLAAGTQHQYFDHPDTLLIPLICYETTFSGFVASAVSAVSITHKNARNTVTSKQQDTKGAVLIALSNDGWFGSSHQPFQHVMASVLRAVENRLPLVHVSNNGPSIVVSPSGQVTFMSNFQQAAGYIAEIGLPRQLSPSFYSQYPHLFRYAIFLLFSCVLLLGMFSRFKVVK